MPSLQAIAALLFHSLVKLTFAGHHMSETRSIWPNKRASSVPLVVTNYCREDIYPGILTQHGNGPDSSGFLLQPGSQKSQTVSIDWQGRVWGRTNCSFNDAGTGPANGGGVACGTGDCGGIVACQGTGVIPVTLAEFTFDIYSQTWYDISLVDGYNLPMGIVSLYPTSGNSSLEAVPPNLTNPVCIGTSTELAAPGSTADETLGTNETYPLPLEENLTSDEVSQWCPWNLQLNPPKGSNTGVYTYPEGTLQRADFTPCYSQCSKTGQPVDCCTGSYNNPDVCKPSIYSADAKTVCPDAYSFAFDDQSSTFIIPSGGGFEVIFCPPGRSTLILQTYSSQLQALAAGQTPTGTSRVGSKMLARAVDEVGEEIVEYETEDGKFSGWRRKHPSFSAM